MAAVVFRDNDVGYEDWLRSHPDGWVVNTRRAPTAAYMQLHRAGCRSISQLQHGYTTWTGGDYLKVCADSDHELEAWAKATVGAGLGRGCHCVFHGLPCRPRQVPVRHSAAAGPVVPAVTAAPERDEDGFAVVRTDRLVPFEPKTDALLEARNRIRSLLAGFAAQPGQLLHGVIAGAGTLGTDLDNALLYNVGGRTGLAARYGVILERQPGNDAEVVYRYRLSDALTWAFQRERDDVAHVSVPLGRLPRGWWDVWAAVRQADTVRVDRVALTEPLALEVVLRCPRFQGTASAQLVKTVIDGLLTALHAQDLRDPSVADVVARLAPMVRREPETVERWLIDDRCAALGVRRRLVHLRGKGIQCAADDARLHAVRLELDRGAREWALEARIATTRIVANYECTEPG